MHSVSGELIVSGLDSATSLIQVGLQILICVFIESKSEGLIQTKYHFMVSILKGDLTDADDCNADVYCLTP